MEESDHSPQLSLPAMAERAGARIIRLPVSTAATTGDKPKRPALWYALYFPQLAGLSASEQREMLQQLAARAEAISSKVSYHPQALICEVRSSLKYFAGLDNIHRHLQQSLAQYLAQQQLDTRVWYAAAPTITGSLLLARSGHNGLVYQPDNLRSALGQLSVQVLQLEQEPARRLHNMGVRYLRDLWRLPDDGLRKRFGSNLVRQLHRALGRAPEPTCNYTPPPAFKTTYDLPYAVDSLDRLLPVADEMLAQLCDFLARRDLGTSQLLFCLHHETREPTPVNLGLRQPDRCHKHLMSLLEAHCSRLALPAPVITIALEVKKFDAFVGDSEPLLSGQQADKQASQGSNLNLFMEQLRARLGGGPVRSINSVAEHCPEYACQQLDYDHLNNQRPRQIVQTSDKLRPFWLLSQPQPLTLRQGRLYHRHPLTILRGPERIETRWWTGHDIRRDYYIAREDNGSRLWIYRERDGQHHWYLHGLFA